MILDKQKPQWTQDQAIAFECACEVISARIAILSGQLAEEDAKPASSVTRKAALEAGIFALANEQQELRVHDIAKIARIRAEYGAIVRAWREEGRVAAE